MKNLMRQRGFTLLELIMVIVIIGIIGGMVAVFMKSPIDAYIASGRRAAMTDVADTVVRRMARDIHKALPNSIRLPTSGSACIEFIPTRTGGRYRDQGGPPDNRLSFNQPDDSFNMLGSNSALPVDQQIRNGDLVAVYNLGITGSDAYNLDNITAVAGTPTVAVASPVETNIRINSKKFPLESGGNRFHVIPFDEQVVSYVCAGLGPLAGGDGPATMYRITSSLATAGPTFSSCPVPVAGSLGTSVLANNLSACSFAYNPGNQSDALVQMTLGLTRSDETVTLYHEVHVDNVP